jgi:hypothetical protein
MSSREYRRNATKLSKVLTIICHCVQKLVSFAEHHGLSFAQPENPKSCSGHNVKTPCAWSSDITDETASLFKNRGVIFLPRKCFFCVKANGRQQKVNRRNRPGANGALLCGLVVKCEEPDLGDGIGCKKHRGMPSVYSGFSGSIF